MQNHHAWETVGCWSATQFTYDTSYTDCYGDQYVSLTSYGLYVGVVLCSASRYFITINQILYYNGVH